MSLADAAHHGAVGTLRPEDADLLLVAMDTEGFDRCGGLLDVPALTASFGAHRVVVLADHAPGTVVRLRAHHAGARHLLRDGDLRTDTLRSIAAGSAAPLERHDPRGLRALGLGPTSRPGAALAYVVEHELQDAFEGSPTIEASGLSRRRTITVRQHLTDAVGIEPVEGGSGAVLERSLPGWRQIHAVVSAAREA